MTTEDIVKLQRDTLGILIGLGTLMSFVSADKTPVITMTALALIALVANIFIYRDVYSE